MNQDEAPFNRLADHMGRAYLRYSFTKGTRQEVEYLFASGVISAGNRVLDVGCGPGRHSLEIARRGCFTHGIFRSLKPGGQIFLTAFSAYFSVRHHVEANFDAATGISVEQTTVLSEEGRPLEVDLTTGCYTPRELRLLAEITGFEAVEVLGGEPGAFSDALPSTDLPELILRARKPI